MFKIIPIVLITSSLFAQNEPIELLNTAQKYVGSMSSPVIDPLCSDCSEEQLARRCYTDICHKNFDPSKPSQFGGFGMGGGPNPFDSDPGSRKEREELSKKITAIIQSDLESTILLYGDKQKMVNSNLLGKDDIGTRLMSVLSLMDMEDEEKVKTLPVSLQNARKKLENLLDAKKMNFPDVSDPEQYLKKKYPGVSLQEAFKKEISELERAESKFLAHPLLTQASALKKMVPRVRDLSVYNDIMSGREFIMEEAQEIFTNAFIIQLVQKAFDSPVLADLIKKIDLKKIVEISQSSKVKGNLAHFNEALQTIKKNAVPGSEMVEYCVNKIISSKNNLAEAKNLDTIKNRGESAKSTFFNKVISKFSTETSKALKENMKTWSFFTKTKEDFNKTIDAQIQKAYDESLKELKDYKSLTEEEKAPINFSLIEFVDYDQNDYGEFTVENLSGYNSLCVESMPGEYDDGAYTASGRISVSYGSVKNPQTGEAIMMHELGHLLESEFEKKKLSSHSTESFKSITSCLKSKHNSDKYIGEDFADLTSALALDSGGSNFECSLLDIDELDKPLEQPKDDEHSSDFFRLLHIETVKEGSLPQTCMKYLEVSPIKKNFKSCWPKSSGAK